METSKSLSPFQAIAIALLLIASLESCCSNPNPTHEPRGRFKGMFVFGTSVIDNGNNNYLIGSQAKANYTPYGIDFPFGSTGRFTNGETIADRLCRLLGLPLVPAFLDPRTKGPCILRGVNFGSGGSGILDTTGTLLGVISMNQQINNFGSVTLPELETLQGRDTKEMLSRYLFMVATGNNDISGYFLNTAGSITLQVYIDLLISNLSSQLKKLYGLGGRKFVVVSVYPLGCSPWIRELTKSIGCNGGVNAAAEAFNARLLNLVDSDLRPNLPGSDFIVVNTYNIITDVINDPLPRGFKNVSSVCCELKTILNFAISCKENGRVCPNRDSFVFFDGQHNTQAINAIVAAKAFDSFNTSEVYPFSVAQLASRV